jgi:hypothetical protein
MPSLPNVTPILLKGTTKFLEEWKSILDSNLPGARELLRTTYKHYLDEKDPGVLAFEKVTRLLANIDIHLILRIVSTPRISDLLGTSLAELEEPYHRLRNGISVFLAHLYGYDITQIQLKATSDLFIMRRLLFQMKQTYAEKGRSVPRVLDDFVGPVSVALAALSELLRPRTALLKVRLETVLYFQAHVDGTEAEAEAFAAAVAQKIPGAYVLVQSIIGRMFHPRMQLSPENAAVTNVIEYMMGGRRSRRSRRSRRNRRSRSKGRQSRKGYKGRRIK